jgi:hypothetical protein
VAVSRAVDDEICALARPARSNQRRARGPATALALAIACAATASAEAPKAPPAPAKVEAPEVAQEDVQLLVDTSLAVARKTLAEEGDFHPFAFFMNPEGGLQRITPKKDAALPEPDALLQILQQAFRERAAAGQCRAIAVVADVVIALPGGGESDALQIGIEHRSGWCRNLFYPFRRSDDGEIRFDPEISGHRAGVVFPGCR